MITRDEILEIHRVAIEMDKNNDPDDYCPGVRNIGIIELMLEYKMREEYTEYYNAAASLHTIAYEHPFNNGNKRTASATALMILKNEGIHLTINEKEKTDFIEDVAKYGDSISIEMVEEWLRKNTIKTSKI